MKKFAALFVLIIVFTNQNLVLGQEDNLDPKYLRALVYLKTNKEINKEIRSLFYSKPKKQPEFVEFNLISEIRFLGIHPFTNQLNSEEIGIGKVLMEKSRLYVEKHNFEPYELDALDGLIEPNESHINLYFSKPLNNFLVLELADYDPKLSKKIKFGRGFVILFTFNKDGSINQVLRTQMTYN